MKLNFKNSPKLSLDIQGLLIKYFLYSHTKDKKRYLKAIFEFVSHIKNYVAN